MKTFSVLILGSGSATPTAVRNPSAQVLNIHERLFLIDCGEGAQMQMRKCRVKHQRINHIFISHLHGDHYLGLAGLIFTMHLLGRKNSLHVYANPELETILSLQLKVSETVLLFPLIFHPIVAGAAGVIFEDDATEVTAFPLQHRVPTHGFVFREKPGKRKIRAELAQEMAIPMKSLKSLKDGEDLVTNDGRTIPNDALTMPPDTPRSYAYCSDTGYTEDYIHYIKGSSLLYHEATFMKEKEASAREKFHSTTIDAANIAKMAGVKKLLIGHYSARYDELLPMLAETRSVFPDSELADDGLVFGV